MPNKSGGWSAATYQDVINSGDNGPAVKAGNVQNSLLAQKMLGTQTDGMIMPPGGMLPKETLQIILDWIAAGAPNTR